MVDTKLFVKYNKKNCCKKAYWNELLYDILLAGQA